MNQEYIVSKLKSLRDQCVKNDNIFQYLTVKFQSWSDLLLRNKDQPVEKQYPQVVESSKKYFLDMKNNYQHPLNLIQGSQHDILYNLTTPESQNQIISANQNRFDEMNDVLKRCKIQKYATFKVKPKFSVEKQSQYQKQKHALKKYVQKNHRITPYSTQKKSMRTSKQVKQDKLSNERNTDQYKQSQQDDAGIYLTSENLLDNINIESSQDETNQKNNLGTNLSDQQLQQSSCIYQINNNLLTKQNMSIKKISESYIEKKTSFEEYLNQILEFEKRFDLTVPDFFKDREIHHFRMTMNNYQTGILRINEVQMIKKMVEVTQNQRLISALLLISVEMIRSILKRAKNIEKNLQEELLIEKEMDNVKEKSFISYKEQITKCEKQYDVKFPEFFKNKANFFRREYYEKRFCLAVSDEDCIQILKINLKTKLNKQLSQILQITFNQLMLIISRAQDLLKQNQKY